MGIHAASQEEWDADSGFPERALLPTDEYIVAIEGFDEKPQVVSKFAKEGEAPRDMQLWKLAPVSFADGSELEDVDGNPVEADRLLFVLIDPKRIGFSQHGPSRTRKFFASALGILPTENIDIEEYEDIFDKQIIVAVGKSETGKNKVLDFRALKLNRQRKAASKPVEEPAAVVEADDELPF